MAKDLTMLYRGFEIDEYFYIYLKGERIFNSREMLYFSIDQCKNIIDQSLAMKAIQDAPQVRKNVSGSCELENGTDDRQRREDQMEDYYLSQHENLNEQL